MGEEMDNERLYARCDTVPLVVHESDMARLERSNKRGFVLNIILICVLLLSWLGFFLYESQFETVTETNVQDVWQDADRGGNNRYVGGDYYGWSEDQDDNDPDLQAQEGSEP